MKPSPIFLVALLVTNGCSRNADAPSDTSSTTKTTTTVTTTTPPPPAAPMVPVAPAPTTLTQANLDRVQNDMSQAEVEAIFGPPTSSSSEPIPIVGGTQTTYNYVSGPSAVTIVFKNDQVKEKHGTFGP